MKKRLRISVRQFFLFVVVFFPLGSLTLLFSRYTAHVDKFMFQVGRMYRGGLEAQKGVEEELAHLRGYYNFVRKIHLMWLAERTVFKDALRHEALYYYISGEYGRLDGLLGSRDEYWAYELLGSGRFRIAQQIYRSRERGSVRDSALERNLEESRDWFELALRNGPDIEESGVSDRRWNYDLLALLTSDTTITDEQRAFLRMRALGVPKGNSIRLEFEDDDGSGETDGFNRRNNS